MSGTVDAVRAALATFDPGECFSAAELLKRVPPGYSTRNGQPIRLKDVSNGLGRMKKFNEVEMVRRGTWKKPLGNVSSDGDRLRELVIAVDTAKAALSRAARLLDLVDASE